MTRGSFATIAAPLAGLLLCLAGCASAPETRSDERTLEQDARATVKSMVQDDPSLLALLDEAHGYAVFPHIGEGGFIASGGSGTGVVYEQGEPVGYAELRTGSVGAQLGGQVYSQLILFATADDFERLRAGNFDLDARTTATAVRSGAAAHTSLEDGTAVFIDDESGLMAGASIGGQSIRFQPTS